MKHIEEIDLCESLAERCVSFDRQTPNRSSWAGSNRVKPARCGVSTPPLLFRGSGPRLLERVRYIGSGAL